MEESLQHTAKPAQKRVPQGLKDQGDIGMKI